MTRQEMIRVENLMLEEYEYELDQMAKKASAQEPSEESDGE